MTFSQNSSALSKDAVVVMRTAIADIHATVESCSWARALVDPHLTLAAYREALEWLYTCHRHLENEISSAEIRLGRTVQALGLGEYRRSHLIEQDLLALGGQLPGTEEPHHQPLHITRISHLCGVLYSLGGSSLGNQAVGRALSRSLGQQVDQASRFFSASNALTNAWNAIRRSLNELLPEDASRQEAAAAAVDTIRVFIPLPKNESRPRRALILRENWWGG